MNSRSHAVLTKYLHEHLTRMQNLTNPTLSLPYLHLQTLNFPSFSIKNFICTNSKTDSSCSSPFFLPGVSKSFYSSSPQLFILLFLRLTERPQSPPLMFGPLQGPSWRYTGMLLLLFPTADRASFLTYR